MVPSNPIFAIFALFMLFLLLRFLRKTSILHKLLKCWRSVEDRLYVYQVYKVPQFNEIFQENQLYRKVSAYLTSLPAMEDSDFANLFSGPKSNDIVLHLDAKQVIQDTFLGARVTWTNEVKYGRNGEGTFILRLRKQDKRRILRAYLQHILSVSDEIEQRNKEIKLYMNLKNEPGEIGRWISVPFTHPATLDTVVMDGELKNKVKADLEGFLKSKQYYYRLGRVWKRSYLLYGPSGTGKSSFIAAMARLLCFDVYHIDMSKVSDDSDLKMLLLQTTSRSIIVAEDLDQFLVEKSSGAVSLSGVLNFMDGMVSCCGQERLMVFTMNGKAQVDQAVMRPGRIDVHIHFPLCDFSAFKSLANSHLGVKEHKLFAQVEEIFQRGASLSPAEIGEIMISNRNSPTRALKSVITALQNNGNEGSKVGQRLSDNASSGRRGASDDEASDHQPSRESVHTVKELRKLYGLLRMGSRRKEETVDHLDLVDKEASRHGT